MRGGSYLVTVGATVVLTAASLTAVAVAQSQHGPRGAAPTGTSRGTGNTASCRVPSTLPRRRVSVMLGDMGDMMGGRSGGSMMGGWSGGSMMGGRPMMLRVMPRVVSAGTVTLVAYNHGTRIHELLVLPLRTGASVGGRTVGGDNTVEETGSLGEASRSCGAGKGAGIRAGTVGWVRLTLEPGRYELLCNLPGHYAAGMYAELDVT